MLLRKNPASFARLLIVYEVVSPNSVYYCFIVVSTVSFGVDLFSLPPTQDAVQDFFYEEWGWIARVLCIYSLHSRYSATEIIKHIASEFKKKLISKLTVEDWKIFKLIDESTTLGKQSTLIVYIKTLRYEKEEIIFIDLIALENHKSETITTRVLSLFVRLT
jgi:hypothetical protein